MKRILLLILVAVNAALMCGQVLAPQPEPQKQPKLIYLEHANTLTFDKLIDQERQVLRGDVLFRQDSVYMRCDSAYFYQSNNSFEAFSNVHMYEGDTLHMWCDSLRYDGNTMVGELLDNVVMRHTDTELHTDYLIYHRQEGEAHYPYGGWIADPQNHLISDLGWYYPNTRLALFRNSVIMRTYDFKKWPEVTPPAYPDPASEAYRPEATLYSDTVDYSFLTSDATILGTSRIVNDTATLYTTCATTNTSTKQTWLYQRSHVVSPGRYAIADTLFYDGLLGYGKGWGNFFAHDTIQAMRIQGDYVQYVDTPQVMTVTQRALALEFSGKDTLYMHADTIRSFTSYREMQTRVKLDSLVLYDTLQTHHKVPALDSLGRDTLLDVLADTILIRKIPQFKDSAYTDTIHYVTCFFGVRYFRNDMQGVCDSLNYNAHDSLATFVGNPIMWNENYQITGDTIFAFMAGKGLDHAIVHNQAFLTQQHDSIHYDQISGKELVCLFDSAQIKQMDVSGNVQTIFYPEEGKAPNTSLIGLNQVVGSYLRVNFANQKMQEICIWPQPVGSLTPIHLVTPEILYLDGFRWMNYLRPTSPQDVFRDVRIKEEDIVESSSLFNDDELNGY